MFNLRLLTLPLATLVLALVLLTHSFAQAQTASQIDSIKTQQRYELKEIAKLTAYCSLSAGKVFLTALEEALPGAALLSIKAAEQNPRSAARAEIARHLPTISEEDLGQAYERGQGIGTQRHLKYMASGSILAVAGAGLLDSLSNLKSLILEKETDYELTQHTLDLAFINTQVQIDAEFESESSACRDTMKNLVAITEAKWVDAKSKIQPLIEPVLQKQSPKFEKISNELQQIKNEFIARFIHKKYGPFGQTKETPAILPTTAQPAPTNSIDDVLECSALECSEQSDLTQ